MPREHNYRIEEGRYAARIYKIIRTQRPNCRDCGDALRIMFVLEVAGKEKLLNLAKAEFPLNLEHGSELRRVLTYLLGKEALASMSGGEFDFESLVGMPADVEIEHIRTSKSDQYDFPFVNVCDIQPAGTLVAVKPAINPEPQEPAK
jgi:hypothetical protein